MSELTLKAALELLNTYGLDSEGCFVRNTLNTITRKASYPIVLDGEKEAFTIEFSFKILQDETIVYPKVKEELVVDLELDEKPAEKSSKKKKDK